MDPSGWWRRRGFLEVCFVPGWRVHAFVDRTLFGKSYYKIHRRLDEPFLYLGRVHRLLFHDFTTAYFVALDCYPGDPNAVLAAYEHILLDEQCSADPEYKKLLENLASLSRTKKKRKRVQTKTQMLAPGDPFLCDMRKLVEIRRLWRLFRS
jgi:hypothetical protein